MAIEGVSGAAASATSSLASSRRSIADNFDTFLSLLTTQLKNQNPLDPMDTNQFTQQLVQFTSVEQQLKTNEFLEAMVRAQENSESSKYSAEIQAVGLIGKTVVAGTTVSELKDGEAKWTYTLSRPAPATQITIRDASNNVVYSQAHDLSPGQGEFAWDGKDNSGLAFKPGFYSINIDARDNNGEPVTVLTQVKGVVESVDLTGDEPMLTVAGSRLGLGAVLSVSQS
jgi:flagellar basal-body rod modification protein FlgD